MWRSTQPDVRRILTFRSWTWVEPESGTPLQAENHLGGEMKRWAWLLAVPVLISLAGAQVTSSLNSQTNPPQTTSSQGTWHDATSSDRMFFPKDMFWGWVQVDLAPPHNEVDPNQCAGNAGQYGGVNAPCSLFARYIIGGILEVRPFGRGPLRRF